MAVRLTRHDHGERPAPFTGDLLEHFSRIVEQRPVVIESSLVEEVSQ
jgi:hypothetical protein